MAFYFNSRPSARGDFYEGSMHKVYTISIHAPPRGATGWLSSALSTTSHFNSRPSARGDCKARLATAWHPYFNSRPSARGDPSPLGKCAIRDFNSRPSARGDVPMLCMIETGKRISIHAPPRGATVAVFLPFLHLLISIHAPPRGATCIRVRSIPQRTQFQFTPLREGRPARKNVRDERKNFNSRPSARGDSGCR